MIAIPTIIFALTCGACGFIMGIVFMFIIAAIIAKKGD